jgi:CRISPR-associated protein Cas1
MVGRIVEIADDQRHLYLHRGFLVVKQTCDNREDLGHVPLDDISAVIANAHGLSYTNNVLVALAERGVPFVLCAASHNAVGMLLPIEGNYQQAHRIELQIQVSQPTQKRLWAQIVRSKLEQQANVLEVTGTPFSYLLSLASKVKSGDPQNLEAQGAQRYWKLLFGSGFKRSRYAGGLNDLLNYGYTVLRAATARAVVAAGLHPSIGLHHSNDQNAMRLVDDLIEPFRPMLDLRVWQLNRQGLDTVTPETKRALVHLLYDDMQTTTGVTPITVCMQRLATSLAQVYLKEQTKLDLPLQGLPLTLTSTL